MDVGAEPDVVGKVPAIVVGVFVNNDVVAIPEPVVAVGEVECADAEVETAEPEAAGSTAAEMPDMTAAEASREVAVFPGMVQMHAGIVASGIVADPLAVGGDVRSVGVSGFVVEVRFFRGGRGMRCGRWAVGGNMGGPSANCAMMLSECCDGKQKTDCEQSD